MIKTLAASPLADVVGVEEGRDGKEGGFAGLIHEFVDVFGGIGVDDLGGHVVEAVDVGLVAFFWVEEMPFAEVTGAVAGFAEVERHAGELDGVEGRFVVGLGAGFDGVAAGEHGGAGGNAERVGTVGPGEVHAAGSERVEIRCVHEFGAGLRAEGVNGQLVGEDDEDIGALGGLGDEAFGAGCEHGSAGGGDEFTSVGGQGRSPWRGSVRF